MDGVRILTDDELAALAIQRLRFTGCGNGLMMLADADLHELVRRLIQPGTVIGDLQPWVVERLGHRPGRNMLYRFVDSLGEAVDAVYRAMLCGVVGTAKVTPDEAGRLLGVKEKRVRQLFNEGQLEGVRHGRAISVSLASVRAYQREVERSSNGRRGGHEKAQSADPGRRG